MRNLIYRHVRLTESNRKHSGETECLRTPQWHTRVIRASLRTPGWDSQPHNTMVTSNRSHTKVGTRGVWQQCVCGGGTSWVHGDAVPSLGLLDSPGGADPSLGPPDSPGGADPSVSPPNSPGGADPSLGPWRSPGRDPTHSALPLTHQVGGFININFIRLNVNTISIVHTTIVILIPIKKISLTERCR